VKIGHLLAEVSDVLFLLQVSFELLFVDVVVEQEDACLGLA